MTRPPQVVMIDDHPLLTHALAFTLRSRGVACTVPTLTDHESLVSEVEALQPDVVLLDLDLGDLGDGSALVPDLVRLGAAVLVVSASRDTEQVGRALSRGATGYIPKERPLDELVESVLATVRGEPVMDHEHRSALIEQARASSRRRQAVQRPLESLSPREAHVLRGLMAGGSVREIAATSHVSEATVRTQVRAVLTKLGVGSQREAVALAARATWR
ncbi:LuxR family transcriptional regulator [Nocardioides aequoreus]|uniref:LuxR family transcriptional regulator n=1 Tax=Nocardioides aequoreus TaxID=397278 RepID=UPI000A058667|nr:response regulator transcription factor [Nocardioides aequoreus]